MSKTGCIVHKAKSSMVIIRADYIAICKNAPDGNCSAAILNQFEYWMDIKLAHQSQAQYRNAIDANEGKNPTQDDSLWVYKTRDDLKDELFGIYGDTKVQANLTWLCEQNYLLKRNNPEHAYDRTFQYQLNVDYVQEKIDNSTPPKVKNNPSKSQNQPLTRVKNNLAIPETTTEVTNKEKDIPPVAGHVETPIKSSKAKKGKVATPDIAIDENEPTTQQARQMIFTYKSYSGNKDMGLLGKGLASAIELVKAGITLDDIRDWYRDASQDKWIVENLNGVPTWKMLTERIISWRDKRNKKPMPTPKQAPVTPVTPIADEYRESYGLAAIGDSDMPDWIIDEWEITT